MRTWLAIVAVVAGLAVMAMPVAHALVTSSVHATHVQPDQDAEKAVPCTVGVCCPAPSLPAADAATLDFAISLVSWGRPAGVEHIGLQYAPEPPPPRR